MGPRLRLLVSFESVWGSFNDVYPMFLESKATGDGPLPKRIYDPDGGTVMWWNIAQVVA